MAPPATLAVREQGSSADAQCLNESSARSTAGSERVSPISRVFERRLRRAQPAVGGTFGGGLDGPLRD